MAGPVPAIHDLIASATNQKTWIRGSSPRMTGKSQLGPCADITEAFTRLPCRSLATLLRMQFFPVDWWGFHKKSVGEMGLRWGQWLAVVVLLLAGPAWGQSAAPTSGEVMRLEQARQDERLKSLSEKLTAMEGEVERRLNEEKDRVAGRIDGINERVGDTQSSINMALTVLTVSLTFLGLLVAGVGYFSYSKARKDVQEWIAKEGEEIKKDAREKIENELKDALEKLSAFLAKAEKSVDQIHNHEIQTGKVVDTLNERVAKVVGREDKELPPEDRTALAKEAEAVSNKPEDQRTFEDWFGLALSAYFKADQETAITFFAQAASATDATPVQVARALVNKGVALGELKQLDEALKAFDAVETRFGAATETALREQVARALVNKGVALRKLNRVDEAIAVYDAVETRFGAATETALREQVAKAVANKSFTRLTLAKQALADRDGKEKAHNLLRQSAEDGARVVEGYSTEQDKAMALGNRGYALFLLGESGQARADLKQALRLGGEKALDWELEDAKLYRLEPQDTEFEKLIRELWYEVEAEIKAKGLKSN